MTARIHAFPLDRQRPLVRRLSAEVVARNDRDDTRNAMVDVIGAEWDKLEELGVDCDEIETRIHDLARELWSRVLAHNDPKNSGAA